MIRFNRAIRHGLGITILSLSSLLVSSAQAAGSVDMQVTSIIKQAMEGYNLAMEANDPAGWTKYFSDNVTRHSPLSDESGKAQFSEYYAAEFKAFKAQYVVKNMVIGGHNAVVIFTWDAVHKKTGDNIKVDMVAVYSLDSSGRFSSVDYYYDTAKVSKVLADMAGKGP